MGVRFGIQRAGMQDRRQCPLLAEFHLVADAGEQADFLHVLGLQENASGRFLARAIPATDLHGRLGELDDLVGGLVILGLRRDPAASRTRPISS